MKKSIPLFFLLILGVSQAFSGNVFSLFSAYQAVEEKDQQNHFLPYQYIKRVEIDPVFSSKAGLAKGDMISINLIDDVYLSATINRLDYNVNGTFSVRAELTDYPKGYVVLSSTNGVYLGNIRIPELNKHYHLKTHAQTGKSYLKLLDTESIIFPPHQNSPIPPTQMGTDTSHQKKADALRNYAIQNKQNRADINIMIVYTPAAEEWADSEGGGIANVLAQSMELAQLASDNSNLQIDFHLVNSQMVDYTESGSSFTDLYRLTFHEGYDPWEFGEDIIYMEEVHEWREEYGADLVAMFPMVEDVGGLGWTLQSKYGWPQLGFSLTRVQQAGYSYTHIHEIGHNMGAHHHKDQTAHSGPTLWQDWPENTWSAGWRWIGDDQQSYCDLMTYHGSQFWADGVGSVRVPYFSNPSIEHQGQAIGEAVYSDNARTLREVRHVIASYASNGSSEDPVFSDLEFKVQILNIDNFDPQVHKVYLTGSFVNWNPPGSEMSIEMELIENEQTKSEQGQDIVYRAFVENIENRVIEFMYFTDAIGTGWNGGEWTSGLSRTWFVDGFETVFNYWGILGNNITLMFDLQLSSLPTNGGHVQGAGKYMGNELVSIVAEVNDGFAFDGWYSESGELVSLENEFDYYMPFADSNLTATFSQSTFLTSRNKVEINMYPNPARSLFTIESFEYINSVGVYNTAGELVKKVYNLNTRAEVSVSEIPKGIYFVKVETRNQITNKKLILH